MPKQNVTKYPIVIIGSGPAGCATALWLVRRRPHLSGYILVLEKFRHPRPKVCAGGITARADRLLEELGARCDVPSVKIKSARIIFDKTWARLPAEGLMRVVRREDFDSALAGHVRRSGVALHEEEPALSLARVPQGMRVSTPKADYVAQAVVGADGARGQTARFFMRHRPLLTALMTAVPLNAASRGAFERGEVTIDFTCLKDGVSGYIWMFPSLLGDAPAVNCGICAIVENHAGRQNLAAILRNWLARRGLEAMEIKGSFGWAYAPGIPMSRPHLLLAGDTAGLDALSGEGIGPAIMFGRLAAEEIENALDKNDFSFRAYGSRVRDSALGRDLEMSARLRGLQRPAAFETFMRRMSSHPSLGRVLVRHMAGMRTIASNRHAFAGHVLSTLCPSRVRLVKTIFALKQMLKRSSPKKTRSQRSQR